MQDPDKELLKIIGFWGVLFALLLLLCIFSAVIAAFLDEDNDDPYLEGYRDAGGNDALTWGGEPARSQHGIPGFLDTTAIGTTGGDDGVRLQRERRQIELSSLNPDTPQHLQNADEDP